ncbi:MAG: GTP cyclohydrolase FolE2 [Armatimonadota bacterium]
MRDVQSEKSKINIALDKVGVKDLSYPIIVLDRKNKIQHTVGRIDLYVNLPDKFRATHMSRFVEVLNQHHGNIHIDKFPEILKKLKKVLKAKEAHVNVEFPYFIEKQAPVSKAKSLMEYKCVFIGGSSLKDDYIIAVKVPVNALCPCGKQMCGHSHNQRGLVTLQVRFKKFIWIEDLIKLVEESASSEVFSLLKREDEKAVIEKAYKNARFVEDIAREAAWKLEKDPNIVWYCVESENYESIHNHNAYAQVSKHKRRKK